MTPSTQPSAENDELSSIREAQMRDYAKEHQGMTLCYYCGDWHRGHSCPACFPIIPMGMYHLTR